MATLAFVFPGQGSWEPGVLDSWRRHPAAEVVDEVGRRAGLDLWDLPEDAGEQTALAQPAILAASLATHRALTDAGVLAGVVAGHSLGEVTAAVAAGALDVGEGASLVAERGRAFERACRCRPGSMVAVLRLDEDDLRELLEEIDGAQVANVNAPGQIVVSGSEEALARLRDAVGERGGRALPLDVEGAFHSVAMEPAMIRVDETVRRLSVATPRIPLVTGVTGCVLSSAHAVRRALVDGVLAPVQWVAVQHRLVELGVDRIVEVGPGGVLAGLARRTLPDLTVTSVATPGEVEGLVRELGEDRAMAEPATVGARR